MSERRCEDLFEQMVESVGVKAFAANMGLSTRQVRRMLGGAQPNPVLRFCEALDACGEPCARAVLDHLCQRAGGYFVSLCADIDAAAVNAVKESAEAIVAITEQRQTNITVREIREAISALAALERRLSGGEQYHADPWRKPVARP